MISGNLSVPSEARLSDYISNRMRTSPFVTLHDARIHSRAHADAPIHALPSAQQHAFITLNLTTPLGILDHADSDPAHAYDHHP